MKRKLLLLFLIIPLFSPIKPQEYITGKVIAKSGLTLRERPGTQYKKITIMPYDSEVFVIDQTGPQDEIEDIKGFWVKVDYQGNQGWVFSGFLQMNPKSVKNVTAIVSAAWFHLEKSKTMCSNFDYFPDGGMRSFYCHILSFISYQSFQNLVGVPIFRKGPHSTKELDLDSAFSFGYYNKKFVKKIREILIPDTNTGLFRSSTQNIYNKYVRSLAIIHYVTYQKLRKNKNYLNKEKQRYLNLIRTKKLPKYDYERYYSFMDDSFFKRQNDSNYYSDGGYNGNVVKTATAFWIRRSIDGTDGEFFQGLQKLLYLYDKDFVQNYRK